LKESDLIIKDAARLLAAAGIDEPIFEAQLLLAHCLGVERHLLAVDPRPVDNSSLEIFTARLNRRAAREPMAYILGGREFWSLDFVVGPGVLVPRPETETLVEAVLDRYDRSFAGRILDLGCGSGILSVVLAREFPIARVTALDRSATALKFTAENCRRHQVRERVDLVRGDWGASLKGNFNLVVANPPYVEEGERATLAPELSHEPEGALFSGEDGLDDIRVILSSLAVLLAPGGDLFMEIGHRQAAAVRAIVDDLGFFVECVSVRDLAGIERVIVCGRAAE